MFLSIIPTLNEEENIRNLLPHLQTAIGQNDCEIIICDGGSRDATVQISHEFGVKVMRTVKGRAVQMNAGVREATGEIYYFLHADTRPPETFVDDIRQARDEGYDMGSYRFRFESKNPLLKINNYFTRFNKMWTRGGDQSLFITRSVFEILGGYREEFVIMEEYDLLRRAQEKKVHFKVMPNDIIVSARKYEGNSYLRVQFANLIVFNMFRRGYDPQRILDTYRKLIDYRS